MMRALDDLVRQGKVLYLGASNVPAWVVAQCNNLADARAQSPFVALQCEYSLVECRVEYGLLPMAGSLDLAMLAWSPLAGGILSGKYARTANHADPKRLDVFHFQPLDERKLAIAEGLGRVAAEAGCSSPQAASAWLLARRQVLPIIGARTLAQLGDHLEATKVSLSPAQQAELDALGAPPPVYPHDYLAKVRPLLHGLPRPARPHRP
jgi:aryl-alcohol dehydrogenase-like predicted oxidoreductase